MKISAVIVAGGKGKRMGADKNKVLLPLCNKEIIAHTLTAFEDCDIINEIVAVTGQDDIETVQDIAQKYNITKLKKICEGGKERQDSVYNGIIRASGDVAVIHDGARCLITSEEIIAVIEDAIAYGASALGVKVKDTLKSIDTNGNIISTIDREHTIQIQTPQVFNTQEIRSLHERAQHDKIAVTDDCSIFEYYGRTVHVTIGTYDNIKLTTPEDIAVGEQILNRRKRK